MICSQQINELMLAKNTPSQANGKEALPDKKGGAFVILVPKFQQLFLFQRKLTQLVGRYSGTIGSETRHRSVDMEVEVAVKN